MTNVNKLKEKIIERGMSIQTLANSIDADRSTLYRKLKVGGETLTVGEVSSIISALGLTSDEVMDIFFDLDVA